MGAQTQVSLIDLARSFGFIGATAWGGAYPALPRVEKELVHRRGWITLDELHELLAVASLVPGPTFAVLAGLIGYRLRGAVGSAVSILGLIMPSSAIVVLLAMIASADVLAGPLVPLQRAVAIAVIGMIAGAGWRIYEVTLAKASRRVAFSGSALTIGVTVSLGVGLPALWVTLGGLFLGMWMVKEKVSE